MTALRAILRSHLRRPSAAAATTLSMGVGVGTATVMFSLMHSHGVPPHDPLALGGVAATMLVAVVLAGLYPTGRALSVQPAALLKED